MARGRKSQYISKITNKDKQLLHAFKSCGYLIDKHVSEYVRERRIAGFVRDGYVSKHIYYEHKQKQSITLYSLTEKGKKLCQKEMGAKYFYKSSSPRHDLEVTEKYMSLSQEQRNTWITEGELRERVISMDPKYEQRLLDREISPTDGAYVVRDGTGLERFITYEVVTSAYGRQEIRAKEEFATVLKSTIEYTKI